MLIHICDKLFYERHALLYLKKPSTIIRYTARAVAGLLQRQKFVDSHELSVPCSIFACIGKIVAA